MMIEQQTVCKNCNFAVSATERKTIADGISYIKTVYARPDGRPVRSFAIAMAPGAKAEIVAHTAPWGFIETVPEQAAIAEREGKTVLAAVNADYFHYFHNGNRLPYGAAIVNGDVKHEPGNTERFGHNWFGITFEGKPLFGNYDDYYNAYRGQLKEPVGGGDFLLINGENVAEGGLETDPRTAVGIAADGTIYLVLVDGRTEESVGATLPALADIMLQHDPTIRNALNMDGGGSTTLSLPDGKGGFTVENVPSDGALRPVYSTLLVVKKGET